MLGGGRGRGGFEVLQTQTFFQNQNALFSNLHFCKIHTRFQAFRTKWLRSIPLSDQNASRTIPVGATHTQIDYTGE